MILLLFLYFRHIKTKHIHQNYLFIKQPIIIQFSIQFSFKT